MKTHVVPPLVCSSERSSSQAPMIRISVLCLALFLAMAMSAQERSLATPVITAINDPNAGSGSGQGTLADSINNNGVIAGNYWDASGVTHGFVLATDGTFTTFDDADAGTASGQGTGGAYGINSSGVIAANYIDSYGAYHGLVRASDGTITNFDPPDAGVSAGQGTYPQGINSAGDISGYYIDGFGVYHGFVRSHMKGNTITTFDAPSVGTASGQGTVAYFINSSGEIAGGFANSEGVVAALTRASDDVITEYPTSTTTYGIGINNAGTVAGQLYNGVWSGVVISADGAVTNFTVSGAADTFGFAINSAGDVTGWYLDSVGAYHGYVRAALHGTIATFDASGAGTANGQGTQPIAINYAGTIVGNYQDSEGVYHGFVRTQ